MTAHQPEGTPEEQVSSGFADAELYQNLAASAAEQEKSPEVTPEVRVKHFTLPDIPSDVDEFLAGILALCDSGNNQTMTLNYAEAPT